MANAGMFCAKGRDGKTDIHGILVKPSHFDPAKHYPVVEYTYALPPSSYSPKKFGVLESIHQIAELGFIVVQADGMGTNYRGKAFHDVCWKNLKDAGCLDRIAWIQATAATRPWMDLNRVGIYGASARAGRGGANRDAGSARSSFFLQGRRSPLQLSRQSHGQDLVE